MAGINENKDTEILAVLRSILEELHKSNMQHGRGAGGIADNPARAGIGGKDVAIPITDASRKVPPLSLRARGKDADEPDPGDVKVAVVNNARQRQGKPPLDPIEEMNLRLAEQRKNWPGEKEKAEAEIQQLMDPQERQAGRDAEKQDRQDKVRDRARERRELPPIPEGERDFKHLIDRIKVPADDELEKFRKDHPAEKRPDLNFGANETPSSATPPGFQDNSGLSELVQELRAQTAYLSKIAEKTGATVV